MDDLLAYVNNTLPDDERERLEAELQRDPHKRALLREWQQIATAAQQRADEEAFSLLPLPDLTPANGHNKEAPMTYVAQPATRTQTQSVMLSLVASSILLLGLAAFMLLNLLPGAPDDMPFATSPIALNQDDEESTEVEVPYVVIADVELEQWRPITADMLESVPWTLTEVPQGAYTDMNEVIGMIPLTTIPAGRLLDDMLIAPNPDPDDSETYVRVIRSDLLSSQPTAYDVLAVTDDLSLFKEWVDANLLYQAYLRSGEPVIVYAIANEDFPEGLIEQSQLQGFAESSGALSDSQWRVDGLLAQMIMVPSSEWTETNDSIQRTYILSNGGAVLVLDDILDVTRDLGEPLIIPDGQVALALPLTEFAVSGPSLMPGDMLYSRRLDVNVAVLTIESLRFDQGPVILAVDPDDAMTITEFIEENPDELAFDFLRMFTFQEDQPGSCGPTPIYPPSDPVYPLPEALTWRLPVDGEVEDEFSELHTGIDFTAEYGSLVHAAADGVIVFSGWNDFGYGNMVAIAHGDYISIYAHMNEVTMPCGFPIEAGGVIGEIGSTGNTTRTHLHFEVRELNDDNTYIPIDPMTVLEGAE